MGEDGRREGSGSSGRASSWSLPACDLSGDMALVGAESMEFEGQSMPSVGRIALFRELGRGGMGVVYFGVNPRLQREVAVKVLPAALQQREDSIVERFVQEARIAAQLESPHLVNVLDVDQDESSGARFIVMEYVNGRSAREWMDDLEASGQRAPEKAALEVAIAATRGLKAAHMEGILHRDLKPHNVLIPADADGRLLFDRAKLADLGLARPEQSEEELTSSSIGMGTPGYVAPEQARDARKAKKPADVLGMGATLYAMLTGKAPYRGENPIDSVMRTMKGEYTPLRELRPDVSEATDAVIQRCLPPEPDDRFKDASALLAALELAYNALKQADTAEQTVHRVADLVQKEEVGKKVVTPRRRTRRAARRRHQSPNAALVVGAVVVLAIVAFLALRGSGSSVDPGLYVTSTPAGATVKIDGKARGFTPVLLSDVAGTVRVDVTMKGHRPFARRRFLVAADDRTEIHARLERVRAGAVDVATRPAGATVTVDGRARGRTPLTVGALDLGDHAFKVELEGHEPWEKVVTVRAGGNDPIDLTLERVKTSFVVLGPPHAEVTLKGQETYTFQLDEMGRAAPQVEAGSYALAATCPGFEPYSMRVHAGGASGRAEMRMRERPGRLSVATVPPEADVLIDDKLIGRGALKEHLLPAGKHVVTLRLDDHVDETRTVQIRGDKAVDLGVLTLRKWCTLDLSALGAGVVARLGTKEVTTGARIAPGSHVVTLVRADAAPQRVEVKATAGPVKVYAQPWDKYQARLRLAPLPEGARAYVGDEEKTGAVASLPESGRIRVRIVRPGYAEVVRTVDVRLGETRDLPDDLEWEKIETRLDLSDLPRGAKFTVGRQSWRHGEVIPAGDHEGRLEMPGRVVADVRLRVDSQEVVRPPLGYLPDPRVAKALAWLAKKQTKAGHWNDDEGRGPHDVGVTGLALLCFLRAGNTPSSGPHKDVVAKGLTFLTEIQDREGCLGPRRTPQYLYGHGCGALALIAGFRASGDEALRLSALRAADFTVRTRNLGSGWGYVPRGGESDTVLTGWQVRVLAAARDAGLEVDPTAFSDATNWLDQVTDSSTGRAGYKVRGGPPSRLPAHVRNPSNAPIPIPSETEFPGGKTESPTAVAVLARLRIESSPHSEKMIDKGVKLMRATLPEWNERDGSIDMHYWYVGTLAHYQIGGSAWKRWVRALERAVERGQVESGPQAGSWNPVGAWGREGGRVYSTAVMCLSLEIVARYESFK